MPKTIKKQYIQPSVTIHNWLRGRDVVEFLGLWEKLHNPEFKLIEFDKFKQVDFDLFNVDRRI